MLVFWSRKGIGWDRMGWDGMDLLILVTAIALSHVFRVPVVDFGCMYRRLHRRYELVTLSKLTTI